MAHKDSIDWKNVIRKETRGIDDTGLGDVQEMLRDNVITKSGVVAKEAYAISRILTEKIDCYSLLFRMTKEEYESLQCREIKK
ncbi:MAG TPA: hypothetical protein VL854_01350 [Nitrososphaeraceae archaeon]|nr:hypothetical protein [Nitrososphaeraceae archaeon]